ncbi:unnamed protein product, partial [Closterium sp. NIES-64]
MSRPRRPIAAPPPATQRPSPPARRGPAACSDAALPPTLTRPRRPLRRAADYDTAPPPATPARRPRRPRYAAGPAACSAAAPPPSLPAPPLHQPRPRRPRRCTCRPCYFGPAAPDLAAPPPYLQQPSSPPAAAEQQCSRDALPPSRPGAEPPCTRAALPPSRPGAEPPCTRAALPPSRPGAEPPCTRAALPPSRPGAEPPCTRAALPPSRPGGEPPSSRAALLQSCPACPACVLAFDAEGRAIDFEVWVDDLQLFLQCDRADGLSLFDLTSGASPAPAADADPTVRSQWATRDAAARLAVRRHLPTSERCAL